MGSHQSRRVPGQALSPNGLSSAGPGLCVSAQLGSFSGLGPFWAFGEAAAGTLPAHPFPGAPGPKQPAGLQLAVTSSPEFSEDAGRPRAQLRPQVRGMGTGANAQGIIPTRGRPRQEDGRRERPLWATMKPCLKQKQYT